MMQKFAILNSKGRILCAGRGDEQAKYFWLPLEDGVSPVVLGSGGGGELFVALQHKDSLGKRAWRACKVIEFNGEDASKNDEGESIK